MVVQNTDLIEFLKKQTVQATFLERLKINYRPLICPFRELLQLVKPEATVLDIGCGSGQFLTLVAAFTSACKLGGLEINKNLVQQANTLVAKTRKETDIRTFDGDTFPGFLADFDTVFLIDVLHHVPASKQKYFLQNIYDGLMPGATLILKDIDAASLWVYFNKLHDLILSQEIGHELSVRQAKNLATEIGFQVTGISEKRMFGYPHFTLILNK